MSAAVTMGAPDFVIVGGGTAGCVLANRLSANGKHRVLLLEAGGEPDGFWIRVPAGFSKLLVDTRYNWRFTSEPEPNTDQRVIAIPRGKGLGGSTLINGMVYVLGQPQDYDGWVSAGAKGWSAAEVAPYFQRIENYPEGGPQRGHQGPVHVVRVRQRSPLIDAFLQAGVEAGLPLNPDYNSGDQYGVCHYQANQFRGRRWSAYEAYLKPARQRPNLTVLTGAAVRRLEVADGRCVGVTFRHDGQEQTVRAQREVLLCAGAVQSPALLECSGIGAPDLLASLGVPVRHASPGVGNNYIDHYCTRMNWRVRGALTLNELTRGWRLSMAVAEYAMRGTGLLALGTGLAGAFVKTRDELPTPDGQLFFMHASYANAAERILDRAPGLTIGVAQLRPESRGSIHARSADPAEPPRICPNFLASPVDRDCLIESMRITRRILSQPAIARYLDHEMSPGVDCQTDADWLAFARRNGQTIYHPVGTCRMGEDESAVVDARLRMRGLPGLRVVDASVMPTMVSGNTQAAVLMIAEKGADMILEDALSAS